MTLNHSRGPINNLLNFLTAPKQEGKTTRFDDYFHRITLVILITTIAAYVIIPVLGLSWNRQAFPGFLIEQTLVVNSVGGVDWAGKDSGIDYPQRISTIQDTQIRTPADFHKALSILNPGETIVVRTIGINGESFTYPDITLHGFPAVDLLRLMWLPYIIGFVYLVSALFVFRIRGKTRTGDAFVFTATTGALSIGLLFDLSTTHLGSLIWTVAIAQVGGSLISLALLFPEEIQPVMVRARLRLLAHSISIGLAVWGAIILYSQKYPWAYVLPWRWSYAYAGVGFIIFFSMMAVRLRNSDDSLTHQQARIIFWGSLIAFTPLAIWFILQMFIPSPVSIVFMVAPLVVFPVVVGLAVLRYRLWDIDLIIRKTLIYSLLMGLLSIIYLTLIILLSILISSISSGLGRAAANSPIVLVLSTLAVIALFSPLRSRIQTLIDHTFYREKYDSAKILEKFSNQVRNDVDPDQICADLLEAVDETMHPIFINLWINK